MRCLEFNYGLCESSEWRDGMLRIAPDALGDDGANEQMQPMQPLGLFARPRDPDTDGDGSATKGAGALYGFLGDSGFIMPTTDPGCIGSIPETPLGSVTLYLPTPSKTNFVHLDATGDGGGYQQHLVKYGNKSLSITLDTSSDGDETITVRHGDGAGIVINKDGLNVESGGTCWIQTKPAVTTFHGPAQFNGGVMLGGQAGANAIASTDIDILIGLINAHLATITAAGAPLTIAAPMVPGTVQGSSKVKIAP